MAAKGELVRLAGSVIAKPMKRLGPLGLITSLASSGLEIGDSIREICAYKKEVKKLNVEDRRNDREATVQHHQIDATLTIAMKELRQRGQHVKELRAEASPELKRTRIDRRESTAAITQLRNTIVAPGISTEDRKLALEALTELAKLQVAQISHSRSVFAVTAGAIQTTLNRPSNLTRSAAIPEEE